MRIFNRQPQAAEAIECNFINAAVPGGFARTACSPQSGDPRAIVQGDRCFVVDGANLRCTRSGLYMFSMEAGIGLSGGGVLSGIRGGGGLYINGTIVTEGRFAGSVKVTGDVIQEAGRTIVRYLKVGDLIGADAYHDDSSNRFGQVNVTIVRLGG